MTVLTTVLAIAWLVAGRIPAVVAGDVQARVVTRLDGNVCQVVFSPDHQILAISQCDKHGLLLVDSKSGKTLGQLEGHTNLILSVAFSRDGRRVATGAYDNTIRLWDLQTRRQLAVADTPRPISLAFSPDGRSLASGHWDPLNRFTGLKFWDVSRAGALANVNTISTWQQNGLQERPVDLCYSPGGRWLAFYSRLPTVNVLEISSGTIKSLNDGIRQRDGLESCLFLNEDLLVSAKSRPGDLVVWDVAAGRIRSRLTNDGPDASVARDLTWMARVPGTDIIVTAAYFHTVAVRDLRNRELSMQFAYVRLPDEFDRIPAILTLSEDGAALAVPSGKKVFLFETDDLLPSLKILTPSGR